MFINKFLLIRRVTYIITYSIKAGNEHTRYKLPFSEEKTKTGTNTCGGGKAKRKNSFLEIPKQNTFFKAHKYNVKCYGIVTGFALKAHKHTV